MALINIMYFSILDEHKINKSPKETNMGREYQWETSKYPGSTGDKQTVARAPPMLLWLNSRKKSCLPSVGENSFWLIWDLILTFLVTTYKTVKHFLNALNFHFLIHNGKMIILIANIFQALTVIPVTLLCAVNRNQYKYYHLDYKGKEK